MASCLEKNYTIKITYLKWSLIVILRIRIGYRGVKRDGVATLPMSQFSEWAETQLDKKRNWLQRKSPEGGGSSLYPSVTNLYSPNYNQISLKVSLFSCIILHHDELGYFGIPREFQSSSWDEAMNKTSNLKKTNIWFIEQTQCCTELAGVSAAFRMWSPWISKWLGSQDRR